MIPTPALLSIDNNSHSIIPTGRLKIQEGKLYQEATVIVHREISKEEPVGLYVRWFLVSGNFVTEVQLN